MLSGMAENAGGTVAVSLRSLSFASLFVALASLVTLAVVVTVKDVDALSTLALALAVLAFVVQLIVYIVQAADASKQMAQSQELHAQMMSMLSQLQERTQGTQKSVDRMNTRLLEALIGKAASEGLPVGSSEFAQVVARGVSRPDRRATGDLSSPSPAGNDDIEVAWPGPLASEEAAALHAEMSTWPPESAQAEVTRIMESLSDLALADLHSLADDLYQNTRPGSSLGPGLTMFASDQLVRDGLAEKVPGWDVYTLTPNGRMVGRLLTARGPVPASYTGLARFREKAKEAYLARLARVRARTETSRGSEDS